MLKKIQRRVIQAAMAAFGTVMLLIIVGINAANYYRTTSMQDHLTAALLSNEQTDLGKPQVPSPPVGDMRGRDPEAAFMTRFFTVHCDADGRVREVLRDYISSVDEETPFPEKCRFSMSEAAWEAAEPIAVLAKAQGKIYSQSIEENLMLYGDRSSIQRMISILLDNAVRYSDDGGEIQMHIYRRRGKICVEVSNTCDLADISDLDRLFDRFYRMDESRSSATGGTGIGLSMVRSIAETHGGRAAVQSDSGKRICFKVTL